MQEEEHVIGGQPSPGQYLNCEEPRTDQDRHMRRDEFSPGSVLAALGGWCEALALQHVADGLSGDLMPEAGQGASDSVITPTGVLARHLYNSISAEMRGRPGYERRLEP